jgi:low temperature requirement protein LtrA
MLDAFNSTYSQLVGFFLTARLFMGSYCLLLSFLVPMVRGMMVIQAVITLIPSALWIASIHVEMPNRLALIWIAIFLDLCLAIIVILFVRRATFVFKPLRDWLDRVFDFYPAVNIEHKTARTDAFVTLVFGYSVVAIIYQNAASFGLNAFFGKAVLGLLQAFCFNWIYFELDGADLFQHAIRRSMVACKSHFPYSVRLDVDNQI